MLPEWIDHLWQSLLFCALASVCAFLTRASRAVFRLWLWRAAALKFLLPFALLFWIGEWLGFPVAHTADPVPRTLVAWIDVMAPLLAPAREFELPGASLWLVLLAGAVCLGATFFRIGDETRRTRAELARQEIDVDDVLRYPGLVITALMSLSAMAIVAAAPLAGAVADQQRRHQLLIENSRSLRGAQVVMTAAAPGMGARYRVIADERGVFIRNANLIDLVAIVYALPHSSVWADQMTSGDEGPQNFWLISPRYDLRVAAPVVQPESFDPYALRQPVTKMLAERFGLQIEIDGKCQPPCGNYGVAMSAEPL